jgi:GT2 family glycosyltransferase
LKIAVVLLNWNGQKLLEQFLPALVQYSPEATLYLADNASTDDSVAFVKASFPTIQIIENNSNLGFAGGYNIALKTIDADILALVNTDVEVTKNWLVPIIETFKSEPKTAIIQPKIRDFKNPEFFEYAGAAGGFIDQFGYPFCRGRIFDSLEKDVAQYEDDSEIFWASGACFFIRNAVYNELGGFDADFFAHQEEIDLCWRAKNRGYAIKYNSKSIVYHIGGATLNQENPRKTFLNFRNSLFALTKNLPQKKLFYVLFIRFVLDGIAGLRFLWQGKWKHVLAILKAHFSFYFLFINMYKKRDVNQIENYYEMKSVVISYYLRKNTVFKKQK